MISPLCPFTTLFLAVSFFFFFNDTATTEIYTLSLHDALPISIVCWPRKSPGVSTAAASTRRSPSSLRAAGSRRDRKSTRLNSSHGYISYAVFCLKKKKERQAANQHELRDQLPGACKSRLGGLL